jgi:hypothetical protein
LLSDLAAAGFIVRYEVGGCRYLAIKATGWAKHQRPRPDEPESLLPPMDTEAVAEPPLPSDETDTPECQGKERKGKERKGRENADPSAPDPCLAFGDAWNDVTSSPLPACQAMTPKRRRHIAARLAERSLDEWRAVFGKIQASAFCCGKNDRTWVATFDWVIGSADVAVKVLEGKYDDRGKPRSRAAGPVYSHWQEECQALHGGTCTKHWDHGMRMQKDKAS